ncbi:type II toxin-antitoxin system Phd/YefM family antitoxin [Roseibium aggregatum]|uniref:type II toxin-antitoxin system Phd/YefM family antitoxin n=1 Tax=Roseibium aggregatum TaxID=187304 RepID=UPI001E59E1FF|nr:type II toxin-antitoxin system Phd/YefM family antitoxin [Roseibium aggregatum]UES42130.1 type II toxin-antitoxin system prevent-host-death family antitoxin [Roseibium aggregatum]
MISLQDAKNRFSAVVEAAMAGRPQEVSRRGKPAVVVISAEEYYRLVREAKGRRESFADHVLSFPGEGFERSKVTPRDVEF